MKNKELLRIISRILDRKSEILFAYIHGSALSADIPRDIDTAIYLQEQAYQRLSSQGQLYMDFIIPLEMELESALAKKTDLQVLNEAPLSFRYHVVTHGIPVIDKDADSRENFECLSRVEYFDFRPRREEYLKEVASH